MRPTATDSGRRGPARLLLVAPVGGLLILACQFVVTVVVFMIPSFIGAIMQAQGSLIGPLNLVELVSSFLAAWILLWWASRGRTGVLGRHLLAYGVGSGACAAGYLVALAVLQRQLVLPGLLVSVTTTILGATLAGVLGWWLAARCRMGRAPS